MVFPKSHQAPSLIKNERSLRNKFVIPYIAMIFLNESYRPKQSMKEISEKKGRNSIEILDVFFQYFQLVSV